MAQPQSGFRSSVCRGSKYYELNFSLVRPKVCATCTQHRWYPLRQYPIADRCPPIRLLRPAGAFTVIFSEYNSGHVRIPDSSRVSCVFADTYLKFCCHFGQGGTLGEERKSSLVALQSTLHGLAEMMAKKRKVDKSARKEAQTLGRPAVISDLLDCREGDEGDLAMAGIGGPGDGNGDGGRCVTGWVTGAQLRALEEQVGSKYGLVRFTPCCASSMYTSLFYVSVQRNGKQRFENQCKSLFSDVTPRQGFTRPPRENVVTEYYGCKSRFAILSIGMAFR